MKYCQNTRKASPQHRAGGETESLQLGPAPRCDLALEGCLDGRVEAERHSPWYHPLHVQMLLHTVSTINTPSSVHSKQLSYCEYFSVLLRC